MCVAVQAVSTAVRGGQTTCHSNAACNSQQQCLPLAYPMMPFALQGGSTSAANCWSIKSFHKTGYRIALVSHLLSSYRAMSLPSSQWPAMEPHSLEMPSMLQPSPRMTYLSDARKGQSPF